MESRVLTPRLSVVALAGVVLAAALAQAVVIQLRAPDSIQYLVVGLSAIAMLVALGVAAYVLRGAAGRSAPAGDDAPGDADARDGVDQ